MKIDTIIDPIEINGIERKSLPKPEDQLSIRSHSIFNGQVIICFHGISCTVDADSLERAIRNATNWR